MIDSKSQIIRNAGRQGRTTLTEIQSKQLIAEAGLHVVVDARIGLADARLSLADARLSLADARLSLEEK